MHRLKKISLWTAGIFGSMLALYFVIRLLLPQFIDFQAVKKEIRSQFSQMVGGRINFDRLDFFVWPIPHIAIDQVKISIPPTLSSTINSSKIYPKILPLLTGEVKIAVVRFESPVLDLKLMDKSKLKEEPGVPFEFMDLGRRVAATLAILPEYTLPDLKFEIRNLINIKNLTLQGRVSEAQIKIPGLNIELEDVSGDAAISRGILQATNLAARMGNVVGQNGELDLGLTKDAKFFQLAIGLQTDLSQLPPMLEKMIDDKKFRRELSRFSELNGNAAGILMLGNATGKLKVQVKANIANLTVRHQSVPYPIKISDGNITYERNRVHMDQFQGEVGRSSFANLSADAYWGSEPYLMIRSGICRIFLEEIHSWIAKTKNISGPLNDIESMNGVLAISTLRLQGPIFRPKAWMLDLQGEPVNLALKNGDLPVRSKQAAEAFMPLIKRSAARFTSKNTTYH